MKKYIATVVFIFNLYLDSYLVHVLQSNPAWYVFPSIVLLVITGTVCFGWAVSCWFLHAYKKD